MRVQGENEEKEGDGCVGKETDQDEGKDNEDEHRRRAVEREEERQAERRRERRREEEKIRSFCSRISYLSPPAVMFIYLGLWNVWPRTSECVV